MSVGIAPLGSLGVSPRASRVYEEFEEKKKHLEGVISSVETVSNDDEKNIHNLPLQAYLHYAEIQRECEKKNDFDKLYEIQTVQMQTEPKCNLSGNKLQLQRKLRIAKSSAVFFLITTDILGPYNAPYAIAQMGYVPGIILYVLFGVFAAICGYFLNICFVKTDSNNFPVRTFADLSARAISSKVRVFFALFQFIQMIMTVAQCVLGAASSVAQLLDTNLGRNTLCYTVNILVWSILGMIVGQIKTLARFSYLANLAVWITVAVCVMTMVGAATSGPNYQIFWSNYGKVWPYTVPVFKTAIMSGSLSARVSGMNNMVFAWGGATVFAEVMAELKRPMDFWKGMVVAQAFILVVYLFFGLFVYSYLGQYSFVTAYQSITSVKLQNAMNIIVIISFMLAAVLYGNVGLKAAYNGIFVPDFNFPLLNTRKGSILWPGLVVIYWAVAYVIGSAIPSISTLVSIIGAFCIYNLSYSFPFMFLLALMWRTDAGSLDSFDLMSMTVTKVDSYRNWSRWKRAISSGGRKRTAVKVSLFLLCLASLANCGLCAYTAIEGAIETYKSSVAAPFTCTAPV